MVKGGNGYTEDAARSFEELPHLAIICVKWDAIVWRGQQQQLIIESLKEHGKLLKLYFVGLYKTIILDELNPTVDCCYLWINTSNALKKKTGCQYLMEGNEPLPWIADVYSKWFVIALCKWVDLKEVDY